MNTTSDWHPDLLGDGYEQKVIELGADPDGQGEVRAVLVRRIPRPDEEVRGTVLYVHGFADYFFQTDLADYFAGQGFAFHALDLRKCGRARNPGQHAHYVSDLRHYDTELDRAVKLITTEHPKKPLIVVAHSTGGLITPLWLDQRRRHRRTGRIAGLVLNSPWLDLQGRPALRSTPVTLGLRALARVRPFHQVEMPAAVYGQSLHVGDRGEWDYDLALKPHEAFPVTVGWLNAVRRGHARIHGGIEVGVPTLVLLSDKSHFSRRYSEASDRSDLVLDVEQIAHWAPSLGADVEAVAVPGARHDVFLSLPDVRRHAYEVVTDWLEHLQRRPQHPRRQQRPQHPPNTRPPNTGRRHETRHVALRDEGDGRMTTDPWTGKVVAVTGAGSGIGRALAVELGRRGARVSGCDVDEVGLAATAALVGDMHTAAVDMGDRDAVFAYAEDVVIQLGAVHQIYNNAGVAFSRPVLTSTWTDYERMLRVNLEGVIHGTQAFLPHLVDSGDGHVINVSSLNGILAQPDMSHYCTTKFAVRGFTECLTLEMERDRLPVKVSVVHPGGVRTAISDNAARHAEDTGHTLTPEQERRRQHYNDKLLRMDPAEAARIILDGVERGRSRIRVGRDAVMADRLVRLLPARAGRVVLGLERRAAR